MDSAATSLKPEIVLEKMNEYYSQYSANIHRGLYPLSEKATEEYEVAREKIKEFIGAESTQEIIFTSGTTDSINRVAIGWGNEHVSEGDEVVVTEMEHHSNFVPWQQLALRKGAKFKALKVGKDFRIELNSIEETISSKTKILAISLVSNVLGVINPVKEISARAKAINPEILIVVDAAQAVAHMPLNVSGLGVDVVAFSGHKMYGPTGVGVLYVKQKILAELSPSSFGGGMIKEVSLEKSTWADSPEKYEAGTPMVAEAIGLGAAVDFISQIGFEEIERQEKELSEYALKKLKELNWVKIFGPEEMTDRVGVITLMTKSSPHDIADILGRRHQVCVRGGHHCTMPLHHKFEVESGTTRISLSVYNTFEDIDKLIEGLKEAEEILENISHERRSI